MREGPLLLDDLVEDIHSILTTLGAKKGKELIMDAMGRLDLESGDLDRYKHFDSEKRYTRNLIATDNTTFTLMLLCWNAGKSSPVHDHPCLGCFMLCTEGQVREVRYCIQGEELVTTGEATANPGTVVFISDELGLHKVECPEGAGPSCTLHLYTPPYSKCKVWLNERVNKSCEPTVSYHSVYGEVVRYETGEDAAAAAARAGHAAGGRAASLAGAGRPCCQDDGSDFGKGAGDITGAAPAAAAVAAQAKAAEAAPCYGGSGGSSK